jgi:1-acyl-sn-glycerol-3-phosphate acyltransferase
MEREEQNIQFKPLDIRNIFRQKSPVLANYIPGFVYTYLKNILHLDFVNTILEKHGQKEGIDFIQAVIKEFNVTMEIKGEENLPESGRYIFASNHPLGGFDGMMLLNIIGKRYKNVKSLSNDILLNIKQLANLFVPVNKHGSQSFEAAKLIEEAFNSDNQILTFPSGLVSRRKKGIIRDIEWKKNFISKSVKYQRSIIPIHVTGRCSGFFYRFANLRKFLGIKYNLEMFYLPDETYKHRNKHIIITIGQPVHWSTFDKSHTHREWALKMQDHVYRMGAGDTDSRFDP